MNPVLHLAMLSSIIFRLRGLSVPRSVPSPRSSLSVYLRVKGKRVKLRSTSPSGRPLTSSSLSLHLLLIPPAPQISNPCPDQFIQEYQAQIISGLAASASTTLVAPLCHPQQAVVSKQTSNPLIAVFKANIRPSPSITRSVSLTGFASSLCICSL